LSPRPIACALAEAPLAAANCSRNTRHHLNKKKCKISNYFFLQKLTFHVFLHHQNIMHVQHVFLEPIIIIQQLQYEMQNKNNGVLTNNVDASFVSSFIVAASNASTLARAMFTTAFNFDPF
jgi:hypothetical protein